MQRFCGKCGQRIPEGGGFCPLCGAPVRPWTPEDERAWQNAVAAPGSAATPGEVPGMNPMPESYNVPPAADPDPVSWAAPSAEPAAAPASEKSKLIINTKEETPEFQNYFDTPGDL